MKQNIVKNGFGLVSVNRDSLYEVESRYPCFDNKKIIQGIEELDILCPVDPTTGHRDSFESIVYKALDPKFAGLAQRVIVELPAVQSDSDLGNDEAKLDTLVSRLEVGSFAERDAVTAQLSDISSVLFDRPSVGGAPVPVESPVATVDANPE